MPRLILTPVALALFAGFVVPALAAGPIGIVAAENFYGDLATQIGGSHVQVTSILARPDDDPHLFESTSSTARLLADAQIVLYNGADYDPWMDKLLSTAATGDRTAIVAADLTGHRSGDNPHLWYDPKTFPAVAAALAAELEKRDRADAADYQANLDRFDAAFAHAIEGIGAVKASYAGISVTATEPVFGYMADAMGLLPVEVLQAAFWRLDPRRTVEKFIAFGQSERGAQATRRFVALEDWANDGAPLTPAAGRELAEAMFGRDDPGEGRWTVDGRVVDPAALACPLLDIVSTTDRIVPAASATGAGERVTLAQGHVGMVVGGRARASLWQTLAEWLTRPHMA